MYLYTDTRYNFQMYLDTDTRYSRVSIDTFTRYFAQIIYICIHICEIALLFCKCTQYIVLYTQYICTNKNC